MTQKFGDPSPQKIWQPKKHHNFGAIRENFTTYRWNTTRYHQLENSIAN